MDLMGMVNGLGYLDDANPLTPAACLMAYKLIDFFNRLRWPESVAVDLNRLSVLAKCSSTKTALRARDELVERGVLIVVRKGKKNSPSVYRLADLSRFYVKNTQNPVLNTGENPAGNPAPNMGENPGNINILYKTIPDQTCVEEDDEDEAFSRACAHARGPILSAYKAAFGRDATPAELDSLTVLAVNTGMEQMMRSAIDMAALASPRNPVAYIRSLIVDWDSEYISTPEELDQHMYLTRAASGKVAWVSSVDAAQEKQAAFERRKAAHQARRRA